MATSTFIKKWNNKPLQDCGSYVSEEYNKFQNAFKREMTKIANNIGANLVSFSKGHYDVSGFIERNGKFVYFSYSSALSRNGRSTPTLTYQQSTYPTMLCRTAKNNKDYRGGTNNSVWFENCENVIDKLLNTEHKASF
jgi:hypothetical protein